MEARHPTQDSSTVKPSFSQLVNVYEEVEAVELKKYGKETLPELPAPRGSQLQLIDSIIYYLHNPQIVGNETNEMKLPQTEDEKRDIVAGAMIFVMKEIKGSYWVRSAENSQVYTGLHKALSTFDMQSYFEAEQAFAKYFVGFNLPDNDQAPQIKSLKGLYTLKQIIDVIPDDVGRVLKIKSQVPSLSKPTTSPATPVDDPSLLYRLTWGFFGSGGKDMPAVTTSVATDEARPAPSSK